MREAKLKFAAEQSRQDRQSAVEYMKAVLQLLIGGAGFLSTAFVAIMATNKNAHFSEALVLPLVASVVAVLWGMLGAHFMFLSKQAFAHRWEGVVFRYPERERNELVSCGKHRQKWGIVFIWLGFVFFAIAATLAACVMATVKQS